MKTNCYTVTITSTVFVEGCTSGQEAIHTVGEAILQGNRVILCNAEIHYSQAQAVLGTNYTITEGKN